MPFDRPALRSLRESLGISADGSEKAFSTVDIENMTKRVAPPILYDVRNPQNNTSHIFVAVDPSGGGASAFSIASVCQDPNGFTHVRRPRPRPRPRPHRRSPAPRPATSRTWSRSG